jgi:hypothetical protein
MVDSVGTRPESVVKRRGKLDRGSCGVGGWATREPLRGGETNEATGASLRGDCWDRKRNSSMVLATRNCTGPCSAGGFR